MTQIIITFTLLIPVLAAIISADPVPVNNNFTEAIVNANAAISPLAPFLPLITIFSIITFIAVFEGIYWGYIIIRWAYRKIAGVT